MSSGTDDTMGVKLKELFQALSLMAPKMGRHLNGWSRCPHCSVASPSLELLWKSGGLVPRGTPGAIHQWATYRCTTCGGVVVAKGKGGDQSETPEVVDSFPKVRTVHEDIPDRARTYLQQAVETLHAPDAAAVMSGSAVDAMLKAIGFEKGSVYKRIDEAVAAQKLTASMGEWAHQVRLGSNRPRHADEDHPHVSQEEATQSVEFAEALAYFLFVLTKRIERGTEAAKSASSEKVESGEPEG
ncbi:DUF4145 domain-containing protein [Sinorhizobium meliloti]|uniref:DUF4145 domain-containing protein n=1 Tax=Rhizobium meliloti TaxID=382 RepID=UPI0018658B4A|nr:DUF4145 domain-containing protein [Sinorhizobium meliloti]